MFFRHKAKPILNPALRILIVTNAAVLVAGAMLAPIYAIYVEGIGGSLLDAGLTAGVFALAAGITTLIAGTMADKIKENELIIVFGYLVVGCAVLLYTICNSVLFLLFIQALFGFGEAIYSPAFNSIYSKHLDKGAGGRQWSAWESINYFSLTVGAVLGGGLATAFGFNVLFFSMAALAFLSAAYIYLLPRNAL